MYNMYVCISNKSGFQQLYSMNCMYDNFSVFFSLQGIFLWVFIGQQNIGYSATQNFDLQLYQKDNTRNSQQSCHENEFSLSLSYSLSNYGCDQLYIIIKSVYWGVAALRIILKKESVNFTKKKEPSWNWNYLAPGTINIVQRSSGLTGCLVFQL